jgi:hypothetical protein
MRKGRKGEKMVGLKKRKVGRKKRWKKRKKKGFLPVIFFDGS